MLGFGREHVIFVVVLIGINDLLTIPANMLLCFGRYIMCYLSITVPAALHIWVLLTYCELNINFSYPLSVTSNLAAANGSAKPDVSIS